MTSIRLIDADPELARHLTDSRVVSARRELIAEVLRVKRGSADLHERAPGGLPGVGFLVLDGLVERDVVIADTISAELLGPGDVIRGLEQVYSTSLLGETISWDVLADTSFAVLDGRLGPHLQRYPEVYAVLLDRLVERVHRLSTAQAISQLNGVDRRLLALFWHLGERWGRVSAEGLVVPLDLPHRVLAQLVGARRPTVSTALRRLAVRRHLRRREDGAWVVDRVSAARWVPARARPVAPRRLRLVREELAASVPDAREGADAPAPRLAPEFEAVRAAAQARMAALHESYELTVELRRTHQETIERCRATQARLGDTRQRTGPVALAG